MKLALALGCAVIGLLATVLLAAGVAGAWFYTNSKASAWAGPNEATLALVATDLTGQRDAPLLVSRLQALGVSAEVQQVAREGATLRVWGAADPVAAVAAVAVPFRLGLHSEAETGVAGGRTRLIERCAVPPCTPIVVDMPAALTNRDLVDVQQSDDATGPAVLLRFDKDGAIVLEGLTQRQIGRRVAIVVDDVVYSAPVVMERITGGSVMVSFSNDEDPASLARFVACLTTPALSGRWQVQ